MGMVSEKDARQMLYNMHKTREQHKEMFPDEPTPTYDGNILAFQYVLRLVGGQYDWRTDLIEEDSNGVSEEN